MQVLLSPIRIGVLSRILAISISNITIAPAYDDVKVTEMSTGE